MPNRRRVPAPGRAITFELPDGVFTFQKLSRTKGSPPWRSYVVVGEDDVRPARVGNTDPRSGILAALRDTPAGLVVRQAIERGIVRWKPHGHAAPTIVRSGEIWEIVGTAELHAIYQRVADALVEEINEPALLAYVQAFAAARADHADITPRTSMALSPQPKPELAPILGRFNGFSYLVIEELYPALGYVLGMRSLTAEEQQADVNWVRVLQDRSPAFPRDYPTPTVSYYRHAEHPGLDACWVRPRYHAQGRMAAIAAVSQGIPADVEAAGLPALWLEATAATPIPGLRWLAVSDLTVVTEDGRSAAVRVPLRCADDEDPARSFRHPAPDVVRGALDMATGSGLSIHPTSVDALPEYLLLDPEAYAHALLHVAVEGFDPANLLTHLDPPTPYYSFLLHPIREASVRAALLAAAAAHTPLAVAAEDRLRASLASVAIIAEQELAPAIENAQSAGMEYAMMREINALLAQIRALHQTWNGRREQSADDGISDAPRMRDD